MASKHRDLRPPVVSTEETRVRPLEAEEPPADDESWEAPEDSTRLVLNTSPPQPTWEEPAEEEVTSPVPQSRGPVSPLPPEDATRPIRRNTGARRALDAPALPRDASKDAPPATAPYTLPPLEIPDTSPAKPSAGSLHAPVPTVTQPDYRLEPASGLGSALTAANASSMSPLQTGEKLRTAFATKAAMIADLVRAAFARKSYGSAAYRLRIDEPDGPSTAGGLLARQPISLVSTQDWAPAIPCGWVDVSKRESQLRNHAAVLKRHRSRYGKGLDLTEEEYDRFFNELVDTLYYGGIKILVLIPDEQETPQAPASARQAPARSRVGPLLWLLLAFALGVGAGLHAGRVLPGLAPSQAGTR
jgi:hypothetical protein